MSTKGVVAIRRAGVVIAKAIACCSGYNAKKLGDKVRQEGYVDLMTLQSQAGRVGFGCCSCLVLHTDVLFLFDLSVQDEMGPPEQQKYLSHMQEPNWVPSLLLEEGPETDVVDLPEEAASDRPFRTRGTAAEAPLTEAEVERRRQRIKDVDAARSDGRISI